MSSQNGVWSVIVPIVVAIVTSVVTIYSYLTLPVYYFLQKPWQKLHIARSCGGRLIKKAKLPKSAPKDFQNCEYREYERFAEVPYHPLMDCETISEAFDLVFDKLYPADEPFQGQREILDEEIQYDSSGQPIKIDGKILRKYKLSDYKWITYGQMKERTLATAKGLVSLGLEMGTNVGIFSETGINFFGMYLSVFHFGGVVVTLFNTLNDEGLVFALNQTKTTFLYTTFELLDRVASLIDRCPHLKVIFYDEGMNLAFFAFVFLSSHLFCCFRSKEKIL